MPYAITCKSTWPGPGDARGTLLEKEMPLDLRTAARIGDARTEEARCCGESPPSRRVCSVVRPTNERRARPRSLAACLCCCVNVIVRARLDGRHPPTVSILPYQIITNQRAFLIYPCSWHCHFFPSVPHCASRPSRVAYRTMKMVPKPCVCQLSATSSEMEMVARWMLFFRK